MDPFAIVSGAVLLVTAGLLVYLAAADLRHFRIRNDLVLALAALFVVYAFASGRWVFLPWHLGFSALTFAALLLPYARGWMGGGDLKLLTVALLWTGPHCAMVFLLSLLAFAILHTLAARFGWVGGQRVDGRLRVAFAPSIAAGLIGVFALGCLRPL